MQARFSRGRSDEKVARASDYLVWATCLLIVLPGSCGLAQSSAALHVVAADQVLIPQSLLPMAHAQEVQEAIGLTNAQLEKFEQLLREVDGLWWKSRILPGLDQRKIVAELEAKLAAGLRDLNPRAWDRLRQIELQAQGARMLLRPEIADRLGIDAGQTKALIAQFTETDRLARELASAGTAADRGQLAALQAARKKESQRAVEILTTAQLETLPTLVGPALDTARFERIYPLAPELIDSGEWTAAPPVRLADVRGEVVLVHFYAFQCHNCVANFPHYRRWEERLRDKGVRIIGIQTPETPAERDVALVQAAAEQENLKFPILIDLQQKNWEAWGNTMWPTVYVIDKRGYIRMWWQGELNWQGATGDKTIEALVERLRREQ